ncbi:MAG: Ig-like domain-containing protein [Myxococcota bacterium]
MGGWRTIAVVGVLAAGCSGDDETTDPTGCKTVLISSHPEDGDVDVYYRTAIDAVIGTEEPDATIRVTDADGAEIPGTLVHDGRRVAFVPDAPLTAGATYTSVLDWSCDPVQATFTVGTDLGDPVDAASLVGTTYLLDLRQAREVAPYGISSALDVFLAAKLLVSVDAASATGLTLSAGSANLVTEAQDVCSETTPFDAEADFSENPYFSVHLDELSLVVVRDDFVMQDLTLSGTFTPDGASIEGLSLDGILDNRSLVTELDVASPEEVCNLFASGYGIDCAACPDGGGDYCVRLVLDSVSLPVADAPMVPRSTAEIEADPVCAVE